MLLQVTQRRGANILSRVLRKNYLVRVICGVKAEYNPKEAEMYC